MVSNRDPVDVSILQNIKKQLEGLKRTEDGMALYNLIERGLSRYGSTGGIEHAFIKFLYVLLGNYIKKDNSDPATRIKARVMQQRLAPYIIAGAESKPVVPEPTVSTASKESASPKPRITANRKTSRWRLVDALTRTRVQSTVPTPAPVYSRPAKEEPPALPVIESPPGYTDKVRTPQQEQTKESYTTPMSSLTKADTDGEDQRNKIEYLHRLFADRVTDTLLRSQDFDGLLRANMKALELAESPNDIQGIKRLLVNGLSDLMEGYQEIESNLKATKNYLQIAQQDRELMQNQISIAMRHSNADRVTSLPLRPVLEAQLEAEIGRAKRFGFSVALALIDLDNFSVLNAQFGRDAGDEVLRYYANEVLLFRAYDVVVRYGNDEFAVMFPNTQKEGALNALEQAQKRAAGLAINYKGKSIVLPTFTSVLTLYAPGEKPRNLLQRAADTLKQVKSRGGDRLVVALPATQ